MRWMMAGVVLALGGPLASQGVIRTSGVGEIRLAPDWASVSVGISTRGSTAAAASLANARVVAAVWDAVVRAGVSRDSVKTVSSTVAPIVDYEHERQIVAYEAAAMLVVTVRDLDRLGPVIDEALGAGATEISGIQQRSTGEAAVRAEAITQAVAAARADAETLARAAGGRLGPLVELSTGRDMAVGPMFEQAQMSVGPGMPDLVIRADVSATWGFIPTPSRR